MFKKLRNAKSMLAAGFIATLAACASTGGIPAVETHDGLTLVPDARFQAVYRKSGADLASYKEFGLAPCKVAFKKNWLRDQNSNRLDLSNRVTQKDVDRIKDSLGAACDEQFRSALLEEKPYALVEEFDNGEQVLVISPSIINLDINAPDVRS